MGRSLGEARGVLAGGYLEGHYFSSEICGHYRRSIGIGWTWICSVLGE